MTGVYSAHDIEILTSGRVGGGGDGSVVKNLVLLGETQIEEVHFKDSSKVFFDDWDKLTMHHVLDIINNAFDSDGNFNLDLSEFLLIEDFEDKITNDAIKNGTTIFELTEDQKKKNHNQGVVATFNGDVIFNKAVHFQDWDNTYFGFVSGNEFHELSVQNICASLQDIQDKYLDKDKGIGGNMTFMGNTTFSILDDKHKDVNFLIETTFHNDVYFIGTNNIFENAVDFLNPEKVTWQTKDIDGNITERSLFSISIEVDGLYTLLGMDNEGNHKLTDFVLTDKGNVQNLTIKYTEKDTDDISDTYETMTSNYLCRTLENHKDILDNVEMTSITNADDTSTPFVMRFKNYPVLIDDKLILKYSEDGDPKNTSYHSLDYILNKISTGANSSIIQDISESVANINTQLVSLQNSILKTNDAIIQETDKGFTNPDTGGAETYSLETHGIEAQEVVIKEPMTFDQVLDQWFETNKTQIEYLNGGLTVCWQGINAIDDDIEYLMNKTCNCVNETNLHQLEDRLKILENKCQNIEGDTPTLSTGELTIENLMKSYDERIRILEKKCENIV
ncbi:hypothetical protein M9Y10_010786 [Tritrichomonas musculus]|uniref:EF-hand domain-containing protein n=1 Tax=Tritrichomonas musculus TaxID=1915356 RepID=A0ABR2ILU5_9EUKA